MSYQAIARKWRPQSFEELRGQDSTRKTLINAVKNDRLHHALLFSGPRGTGKTSTARILSKILRCTNLSEDSVPCGKCKDCEEISTSRNLDVLEIDGASNNGVDSIRELRDQVSFNPTSGSNKIYIIDEVHMLSTSAFNALLKTLEEPPESVYFMMATTEPHKLPKTILSRCQRYDFKPVPLTEVLELLKNICTTEEIEFDEEALFLIAQTGNGCVRDSLSFLDQAITFSSGKLSKDEVSKNLGVTDVSSYKKLLKGLIHRDTSSVMEEVLGLRASHIEPQVFIEELVVYIKNTILFKVDSEKLNEVQDYSEVQKKTYNELSEEAKLQDLYILFDIIFKGAMELSRSFDPFAHLEVTLMKAGTAPFYEELAGVTSQSSPKDESKKKALKTPEPAQNNSAAQAQASQGPQKEGPETQAEPEDAPQPQETMSHEAMSQEKSPKPEERPSASGIGASSPYEPASAAPASKSLGGWHGFVKKVKDLNPIVGAKLEACEYSYNSKEKKLSIQASSQIQFMEDELKSDDFLKKVQNYLNSLWGPGITVSYYETAPSKSTGAASEESGESTEGAETVSSTPAPELKKSVQEQSAIDKTERLAKLTKEAENHSVIKTLVEKHGAKIKRVEELSQGES